MNTPCFFFIFTWFSLEAKTFQAHLCKKQTILPVIQFVKKIPFPVKLMKVTNMLKVFNVCSVRNHFSVKQIVFNGQICKQTLTNSLSRP